MIDELLEPDAKDWPAAKAWLADYHKQTKGIGPEIPLEKWPAVDLDALLDHNPNFWRMYYDIAPGDPGLAIIHVGLLLSQGESMRAQNVLDVASYRPGIPAEVLKMYLQIQRNNELAIEASDAKTKEGIELFDQRGFDGALKKYREALELCPQNGDTYYELGYTLRTKLKIAAGEEVDVGPGTKARINVKSIDTPEVTEAFAKARKHYPLGDMAYQGTDREVIQAGFALREKVLPAWEVLHTSQDRRKQDAALEALATGAQEAGIHDLALISRQIIVARRHRYVASDHPLIAKSLRQLAPGDAVEETLKLLAAEHMKVRPLIDVDSVDGRPASGEAFHNPLDGKTYVADKWKTYTPENGKPAEDENKVVRFDNIRFLTSEQDIAERTTTESVLKFIKDAKDVAENVLEKSQKPCKVLIQFTCTPSGHTIKVGHQPEDVDEKPLKEYYKAAAKMAKLEVKKETVEFQLQFTVTPKK